MNVDAVYGSKGLIVDIQDIIQIVIDMRPRPTHVNITQAAEMLGKSAPTVRKYIKDGIIKLNKANLIPITEIDKFAFSAVKKNRGSATENR